MNPIIKYEPGGSVLGSLLIDYTPFQKAQPAAAPQQKSESKESSSSKVGLKDLLGLVSTLKNTGLPVDIDPAIENIRSLFEEATLFGEELSSSDIVSIYLSALKTIRIADSNQKEYEKAKDIVNAKDGLNEVAIDDRGRVFVQNVETGEVSRKTVSEYNKIRDSEKYQVLTNNNLLYFRAHDPNFAFKNEILGVVSNGIGMSKVNEQLLQVIKSIGTNELKMEGYSERKANDIVQGLALLEQNFQIGMNVEGLYKQSKLTKDQKKQAEVALKYLWSTLPQNAKSLLKVKGGSEEGAYNLMQALTFSSLSETEEYSNTLTENPKDKKSGSGKKGSGSGSEDDEDVDKADKDNFYRAMIRQEGGTQSSFELNTGTNHSLKVDGTYYSNLKDADWKPIGHASLETVLNGGLSGIIQNTNGISFGDKVISTNDFKDLMYDNGGGIMVALPAKVVNGTKVVDLSILKEYNEATQEFESRKTGNPQTDKELYEEILKNKGLEELLDANGLPDRNRFQQFLVISAYGVDKQEHFEKNTNGQDNEFIEEVDPDDGLLELLKHSLSTDDRKTNYKIDNSSWAPGDWFGNYDRIYKGNLYIPITVNENAGIFAGKGEYPYYIMKSYEEQYQNFEKRRNTSQITSADVLNL